MARIAVGGFQHETNCFVTPKTDFAYFASHRDRPPLVRGDEVLAWFRDISFGVRAGEILGVAGLIGAGRTELVRAISGADPTRAGEVLLDGKVLIEGGSRGLGGLLGSALLYVPAP